MAVPKKCIAQLPDMDSFAKSPARMRIVNAVQTMADSVTDLEVPPHNYTPKSQVATEVKDILILFNKLVDETPPQTLKQRFGNTAYREWLAKVESHIQTGNEELDFYLANAFGSKQRIDYGTGHELNFLAFWDGLSRVRGESAGGQDLLHIFDLYFTLCRKFITVYSLEPAGSHGVWGLDDHFHLPFILGAGQLSQLSPEEHPKPRELLDVKSVERYKGTNLYFAAIDFIFKVKRGPFFEHSPVLYDVSGVKSMAKIKSGMIKMYHGEVLGKLQVMQHFYFGTLFEFEPNQ